MSSNILAKTAADSWTNIVVNSVETPVQIFNSQTVDPPAPPLGKSKLYYNSNTGTLRVYNTALAVWEDLQGGIEENIYSVDGTLTADRTVNLGTRSLSFASANSELLMNDIADEMSLTATAITIDTPILELTTNPAVDATATDLLVRDGATSRVRRRLLSSIHPAVLGLIVYPDGLNNAIASGVWTAQNGNSLSTIAVTDNNAELPSAIWSVNNALRNRIIYGGIAPTYVSVVITFNFRGSVAGIYDFAIVVNEVTPPSQFLSMNNVVGALRECTVCRTVLMSPGDYVGLAFQNSTGLLSTMVMTYISINVATSALF